MTYLTGSHHVTLSVGGAQEDVDFHTRVLGLRFIKKTVLYDGSTPVYHLYYSNAAGDPSSVVTTFPWAQHGIYGSRGTNQAREVMLSVPVDSLEYWSRRLTEHGVDNVRTDAFGTPPPHAPSASQVSSIVHGSPSSQGPTMDSWTHSSSLHASDVHGSLSSHTGPMGSQVPAWQTPSAEHELLEAQGELSATATVLHVPVVGSQAWKRQGSSEGASQITAFAGSGLQLPAMQTSGPWQKS